MKRILLLFLCIVMLATMVGCNQNHVCGNKCGTCGKCTYVGCTESVCADKCPGHSPAHTCVSVCDTCGKCTNASCTESVCSSKCPGHAPTHTCSSACNICGKCTNINCTESVCSSKCPGHEPEHQCTSICGTCGKCMDTECTESACSSKCLGHVVEHACYNQCGVCGKCTNSQCTEDVCQQKCPGHVSANTFFFNYSMDNANADFYEDFSEEEKQLYFSLWEPTTSISIKMDISPYELAKISEGFKEYSHNSTKADTYRKCNLTITVNGIDYYYEEVGVRMRGNTSRREFTNDQGEMYAYVHFRFDLSETFDGEEYAEGAWGNDIYHDWSNDEAGREQRKDRTFATMEKFYYKWNKNYDNTYIREVYANKMFQAYGILAPHITLTQLSVTHKGQMENLGVGGLYEVIDKNFIKRYLDKENKGGDLYKCTYTIGKADLVDVAGKYGIETATQRYTYDLKTNNDREDPDYHHNAHLKALANMLATNKNDSQFVTNLEALVDMDYFARFEAVNYLLGNPDCIRNNANNYYLYFTPDCKAIFIPYDYDRCLGINKDWNPSGDGMISATPYTTNNPNGGVSNPLYLKTILSGGISKYQNMYKQRLQEVLDGNWFTYDHFVTYYNRYSSIYSSVAKPSQAIIDACGHNVDMSRLFFSLDGTKNFSSNGENISTKDYMEGKRKTALNNINNIQRSLF